MTVVRKVDAACSDFDELSEDWSGSDERQVTVSFIAVLPVLFGMVLIGLAYWGLK